MPTKTITPKSSLQNISNVLLAAIHRFFFIVVLIAFFAVIIVGYLFLVQPKFVAIADETKTKEGQENQQLQDLQSYFSRLIQYRDQYNKIDQADKDKIGTMIAGKYLPEDTFTAMEKLVAAHGLILSAISVSTAGSDTGGGSSATLATNISGVGQATIQLSIAGVDYAGLKQLLAAIESDLQLSDVQKIDFSPEQNTATLIISTYYLN